MTVILLEELSCNGGCAIQAVIPSLEEVALYVRWPKLASKNTKSHPTQLVISRPLLSQNL